MPRSAHYDNVVNSLCEGAGCWYRHETGRGRLPACAGWKLCPNCRNCLGEQLEKLPELYAECGRLLNGSSKRGQPRERRPGQPVSGMPFNAAAADVRSRILGVLGSWSGMVAGQRGIAAPRRNAAALAKFLGDHGDWLAAHPAAGDPLGGRSHHLADRYPLLKDAARTAVTTAIRRGILPPPGS